MAEIKADKEKEYKKRIYELEKQVKRLQHAVKKEKYGLVWMDVPEAFEDDVENKLPILKEIKDKAIVNDDGKPTHILIEGDNYHALTCLNYTHKENIDVIYIDPPYNTGSDGFRYRDKRTFDKYPDGTGLPKDHPLRHSYWLSFMEKRLELAKSLLKDTGVILISIDDNEVAQLKILCDVIFGERNFVEVFSWVRTETPARLSKKSIKVVEYVLCYQKSEFTPNFKGYKFSSTSSNTLLNQTNAFRTLVFPANIVDTAMEDGVLKKGKYGTKSYKIILEEDTEIEEGTFIKPIKLSAKLRWTQEKLNAEIDEGTKVSLRTITLTPSYSREGYEAGAPKNLIDRNVGVYTNEFAKAEIDRFGLEFFDYPKPVTLIKYLCSFIEKRDCIILDFFSGSGTTAQAVLELNEEDGGYRQWIMVTNNENQIMKEVCYPRVEKVINGYEFQGKHKKILFEKKITWSEFKNAGDTIEEINAIIKENNKTGEWEAINREIKDGVLKVIGEKTIEDKMSGLGNSIKYYKTDFIGKHNIKRVTDEDKIMLAHHAGELLAIAENTLYEISKNEYYQFFTDRPEEENISQYTSVYFREELLKFEEFVEKVRAFDKPVAVYVFSWGGGEFDEYFEDINTIRVKPIPQPILEIYKSIYNIA